MLTKEQALAIVKKNNEDKARRRLYNQKRWTNKKNALKEAQAILANAKQ